MKLSALLSFSCVLLTLSLSALTACSDDTQHTTQNNGEPSTTECPRGERYNPIVGRCVKVSTNNTPGPNNIPGPTNNAPGPDMTTRPDMSSPPDMTTADMGQPGFDMASPDMRPPGPDMTQPAPDMGSMMCGPGTLKGSACAPSGERIAGATVTVEGLDCQGQPFTRTAQTGPNGAYEFADLPSGDHNMLIASGSFNRRLTVTVRQGQVTDLAGQDSKYCLPANDVKIAVVGGAYDNVEGILADLQLQFDRKGDDNMQLAATRTFLKDLASMSQYNIIFINCGDLWVRLNQNHPADVTPILNNLRSYVQQGGSLYASDLSHPLIERAMPDLFDFRGNDANLGEAQQGYAPQTLTATVTSPALQAALGRNTVQIAYPHDPLNNVIGNNWAMLEGVGAASVAHVTGDPELCGPRGIINPCPRSGTRQTGSPLLASYKDPMMGGSVVYTTFHNKHRQGVVSQDVVTILKYFIFQF